jgi:hypothetical protein
MPPVFFACGNLDQPCICSAFVPVLGAGSIATQGRPGIASIASVISFLRRRFYGIAFTASLLRHRFYTVFLRHLYARLPKLQVKAAPSTSRQSARHGCVWQG